MNLIAICYCFGLNVSNDNFHLEKKENKMDYLGLDEGIQIHVFAFNFYLNYGINSQLKFKLIITYLSVQQLIDPHIPIRYRLTDSVTRIIQTKASKGCKCLKERFFYDTHVVY